MFTTNRSNVSAVPPFWKPSKWVAKVERLVIGNKRYPGKILSAVAFNCVLVLKLSDKLVSLVEN